MMFFAILFVIIIGVIISNWYLNEKAPTEQMVATLSKKKRVTSMDANNVMYDTYYFFFEVNGETKKFKVSHSIYNKYNEGDKGVITFKRNRFISFN